MSDKACPHGYYWCKKADYNSVAFRTSYCMPCAEEFVQQLADTQAENERLRGLLTKCKHTMNEHNRVDTRTVTLVIERGRYQQLLRELAAALNP